MIVIEHRKTDREHGAEKGMSLTQQPLIRLRVLVRLRTGDRDPNRDEVKTTLLEVIKALGRLGYVDEARELLGREHDEAIAALSEQKHRNEAIGEVIDETVSPLYALYASGFYWYGRRRGLFHQDAEDVVQQTFERILCRIETFNENKGAGEAWMWQIFRSRLADFMRGIRPDIPIEPNEDIRGEGGDPDIPIEFVEDIHGEEGNPEIGSLEKEQFEALRCAISHLPEEELSVIRSPGRRGPPSEKYKRAVLWLTILYHMFYDRWIVDNHDMDEQEESMNDRERHLFQALCSAWHHRDFLQAYQRVIRRIILSCEPASPEWHEAAGRLHVLFLQEYFKEH